MMIERQPFVDDMAKQSVQNIVEFGPKSLVADWQNLIKSGQIQSRK